MAIPTNKGDGVLAGGYVPAGWSHPEGWSLILIAYGAFAGHVDDEGRPICEADPGDNGRFDRRDRPIGLPGQTPRQRGGGVCANPLGGKDGTFRRCTRGQARPATMTDRTPVWLALSNNKTPLRKGQLDGPSGIAPSTAAELAAAPMRGVVPRSLGLVLIDIDAGELPADERVAAVETHLRAGTRQAPVSARGWLASMVRGGL